LQKWSWQKLQSFLDWSLGLNSKTHDKKNTPTRVLSVRCDVKSNHFLTVSLTRHRHRRTLLAEGARIGPCTHSWGGPSGIRSPWVHRFLDVS
jgi:hypothetical protein